MVTTEVTIACPATEEVADGELAAIPMMIAEVSEKFAITHRALRFYEARGLIRPKRSGRDRHYGAADIDRIAAILKLKSFGFSLLDIERILKADDGSYGLSLEQCAGQLALLRGQLASVQDAIAELEKVCPSA